MGSKPATTTSTVVDPTVYKSEIPQQDFDATAKYVKKLEDRLYGSGGLQDQIYAMTGAPVNANVDPALLRIGASKAATDTQARKTYAASISPGVIMDQFVNTSTAPKLSNYSDPTPPAASSTPQQEDPRIAASNFANTVAKNEEKTVYTPAQETYAAAAQKVAEAKANPESTPAPVEQPKEESTPKVTPSPVQQTSTPTLKRVPSSVVNIGEGNTRVNYGNAATLVAMQKYAKDNNKKAGNVSWEDIGYDSSTANNTRPRLPI